MRKQKTRDIFRCGGVEERLARRRGGGESGNVDDDGVLKKRGEKLGVEAMGFIELSGWSPSFDPPHPPKMTKHGRCDNGESDR